MLPFLKELVCHSSGLKKCIQTSVLKKSFWQEFQLVTRPTMTQMYYLRNNAPFHQFLMLVLLDQVFPQSVSCLILECGNWIQYFFCRNCILPVGPFQYIPLIFNSYIKIYAIYNHLLDFYWYKSHFLSISVPRLFNPFCKYVGLVNNKSVEILTFLA